MRFFLLAFICFLSHNSAAQTLILNPEGDGGFENGDTLLDNNWRVTNSTNTTRNQWVSNIGAVPGFNDRRCAYITNNAGFAVPPHKYTASPARASHIFRDITVPVGESEITLDFIWIGQGDGSLDRMRIWLVPFTYVPVYGTQITAAPDRLQLGVDYSGSSSWSASPTIIIPPNYAGTTFRFIVEWANNPNTEYDPPAGIDAITIISTTPVAPPNDEPCAAIALPVTPSCTYSTYTNYGATNTTTAPLPGCANYTSGDVWFTTTVPASGGISIDTQTDAMTDSGMAIYSGTCNALTLIECDDNDSPNGLMSAIIRTDLTPGQTLYIRVWENGNDNNGTFGICVTTPPPPPLNDDCFNAVGLTVNPSFTCTAITAGSTAYATPSSQPDDVTGTPDNDVWFSFVATNPIHRISILDIIPLVGTSTDMGIGVYRSPSGTCASLIFQADSDPEIFNVTGLTVGTTYFVRVYGWGAGAASAQANFNICVSTPPPPPSNDNCNNAIGLTITPNCNYSVFTNAGATPTGSVPAPGCANYVGGDVWFFVTVDATGEITVDTQAGAMTDGGMALYIGNNCNNLNLLECDDNDSANGLMPSITYSGLTPGQVVYIRVWENGNDNNGTFGICVTSPSPPGIIGVNLPCPGDTSQALISTLSCNGTTNLGNVLSGILQGSNPVALQPVIFISSNDPCEFDTATTSNYSQINFTVNTTGTYVFTMNTPSPYFDAMGYIVVNDGNFVPGSCASGTYLAGDDDDGPALNPQITANLIAGVPYKLITTKFAFTSTTHIGPYRWNVVGPPANTEWFVNQTGGAPIGNGVTFNPVGVAGSGLPDTNTPGIYTFWANCPDSTFPREPGYFVIGKIWNGSISADWNNSTNWTPIGKPTSSDCVYISNVTNNPILDYPGIPTPPNPAYAKNLSVGNNASLELALGTSLTVTDWVNVANSATFLIRNNASLIQETDVFANMNTGNINMQRTVNSITNVDYVYWSSSVENFGVTSVSPGSNVNLIWHWIPTIVGNGIGNYGEWQRTTQTMQNGKGYIIRGLSGTSPTAPAPAPTAEFIGKPNNGIINVPIQRGNYSGANYPGAGSSMATAIDDNWNLIGNPYPSAISARTFINRNADVLIDDANPAIAGTIYLWRHLSAPSNAVGDPFYGDFGYNYNPNDYIKFNGTGSTPRGFSGYIAAGQGFFVLMDHNTPSTTSSVEFNNTMRRDTYRNDQFYRMDTETERHRIWLDLIAPNTMANSILIGYVDGATNGLDRLYDGHDLSDTSTRFYSLIADENMAIQGKALPFDVNDTVPLGIVISQNGTYTIAINAIDGLFDTDQQSIFLEDTVTNTLHDLRSTPYEFTSVAGTFNERFSLRYTDQTLSTTDLMDLDEFTIMAVNDVVKIASSHHEIKSVIIYDVLGRVLVNELDINALNHNITLTTQSKGTLIVKATLNNGQQKIKKIMY